MAAMNEEKLLSKLKIEQAFKIFDQVSIIIFIRMGMDFYQKMNWNK